MTNTNVTPFGQIIADAMTASEKDGTLQRSLTILLFDQEVEYSLPRMVAMFKNKGADWVKVVDGVLTEVSPAYAQLLSDYRVIHPAGKKGKSKGGDKLVSESEKALGKAKDDAMSSKLRAARVMFQRALQACFHLRKVNAESVEPSKVTKGAVSFYVPSDRKGKKGDVIHDHYVLSISALTRAGVADVDKAIGNAGKSAKKANAAGTVTDIGKRGMASAAGVLTTFIQQNAKPLEDYGDEEEAALNTLLDRLIVAKFADDKGRIDPADVAEYVATIKPVTIAPTKKPDDKAKAAPTVTKKAA